MDYGRTMDGPLGEDGPVAGGGAGDRGLFGHGHGSYDGGAAEVGPGYGGRPPMPYEPRRPPPQDTGFGGASGQSDLGYGDGTSDGYGDKGLFSHGKKDDDDELDDEKKHKHYAEATAVAAVGYALYERHEKNELEEKLEGVHGYDSDGNKKPDSQKYDY